MEENLETHHVEAIINPEAVSYYYHNVDESGKGRGIKDVQMRAKQHLAAIGWRFYYIYKKGGKRELRYCPPNSKKKYISLRMACKGYLDSQEQSGNITHNVLELQSGKKSVDVLELQSGKGTDDVLEANVDVLERKKRRLSSGDVYGERMLNCMKGKDVVEKDDVFVEDTQSDEQSFDDFYNDLFRDVDAEDMRFGSGSGNTDVDVSVLSGGEDSKLDKRVKKRKIGGKGRLRGKLAWLIENELILPLSKVYYRNKSDGTIMGEGRVTVDGIDCSCCHRVWNLTNFEEHVGSTNHRRAANIFVEDGRSLMQIAQQMTTVDKQVKGIDKEAKGKIIGSVSGTMQQSGHDDFCLVCRETGELVFCYQCTSAFHTHCLGLSEAPASEFWYCASCCCSICGQKCPRDISEPSHTCDQCEQQFHVKCLGGVCVAEPERKKCFCSEKCKVISSGLDSLLGKTFVAGENNLRVTILKNEKDVIDVETTRKLNLALAVMHECFMSSKEPWNGRDVAEDVIFSRQSQVKRLDYRGFYTVILEQKAEVVTVANVRIFGDKVAEIPLVATRFKYRRLGMCKILMDVLEQKLKTLGVQKLVLPAISSVVDTWTSSFGFTEMTPSERTELINYTLLNFPGTVTCQKLLAASGSKTAGSIRVIF